MIVVNQHTSAKYSPRTRMNAEVADVTVTFACDPTTRGEVLTHNSAGKQHIGFLLTEHSSAQLIAGGLLNFMVFHNCTCLNIAGNGIFTLNKHGWNQPRVNSFVADVLNRVTQQYDREFVVVTGGQTGVDLAGAVAAVYCGLDTTVTLPRGYIQRGVDGIDRIHTREQIEAQIVDGAAQIETVTVSPSLANLIVDL